MIAVRATVRPSESVEVLHLLEQCLRRHFASFRLFDDSLIIDVPLVGRVLVTEDLTLLRLDFLVEDASLASAAMIVLEEQLRSQVRHQGLAFAWDRSDIVPPALR